MLLGDDEPIQRIIAKSSERRDLLVGNSAPQSIFYTAGAAGGFSLPIESEKAVLTAIAAYDPLVSSICDFQVSDGPFLQPTWLSGWDLSQVTSQNILEGQQQLMQTVPTVGGRMLRSNNIHRFSLGASIESETDVPSWLDKYSLAAGTAFGRGLGKEATIGNGTTQAQGIFTALGPAVTNIGTGSEPVGSQSNNATGQDLLNLFYSLNKAWRASPKCAFLCSDRVYFKVRNAVDNQSRPLISIEDGEERLLGRPLYVSPSLGSGTLGSLGFGALIFGALDQFHIRISKPQMRRSVQQGVADITRGEAAFISIIRMDSALTDFSNSVTPPVVWGAVTTA